VSKQRFRVYSIEEADKLGFYTRNRWDEDYEMLLFDFKDEAHPILIASDRMEPEDVNFYRDLAWIPKLLTDVAEGK
jgi:hypothetical protein